MISWFHGCRDQYLTRRSDGAGINLLGLGKWPVPYAVGEWNKGSVTDNGDYWRNTFSTEFLLFEKCVSPGRASRCQEDHDSVNATPYPDVESSRSPEALTPITVNSESSEIDMQRDEYGTEMNADFWVQWLEECMPATFCQTVQHSDGRPAFSTICQTVPPSSSWSSPALPRAVEYTEPSYLAIPEAFEWHFGRPSPPDSYHSAWPVVDSVHDLGEAS